MPFLPSRWSNLPNPKSLLSAKQREQQKTPETENMYDMIKGYDIVGPQIATKLFNDSFKEEIAYSMLNDYILPCLTLVQNGSYLEAVNLYDNMTMTLYNFYFKKEDNLPLTRKKD